MKHALLLSMLPFTTAFTNIGAAQSLVYQWLNHPCAQNLNCLEGCSACNMPATGGGILLGSATSWLGVDVCPHPVAEADNAVHTTGWPQEADPMVFIGFNAVSAEEIRVDSVVVRHRRSAQGPRRLRMTYSPDMAAVPVSLGEVDVEEHFQETVYTDLGCLVRQASSPYSGLQLRLQGLQGGEGELVIDEVRVVYSPCGALSTGIQDVFQRSSAPNEGVMVDVLGRRVDGSSAAPGVYLGARKRVQVVP